MYLFVIGVGSFAYKNDEFVILLIMYILILYILKHFGEKRIMDT